MPPILTSRMAYARQWRAPMRLAAAALAGLAFCALLAAAEPGSSTSDADDNAAPQAGARSADAGHGHSHAHAHGGSGGGEHSGHSHGKAVQVETS